MTRADAARGSRALVGALQTALAAENAAIYGYGVAGAHFTGSLLAQAQRDWDAHQAARDTLTALVSGLGAQPVAAAVSYHLPVRVSDPATAMALLALLEDRVAAAYLPLVALTANRWRSLGTRSVETAAIRAAQWRGSTVAFPGLPEPSSAHARNSH